MKQPLVSVIIPAYNAERYVREAVESVFAQQYRPIEVVCVDDCSTDDTADVLASFGSEIRVISREQNGGIGVARNDGLQAATGELIAFLDADDYWSPDKLTVQQEFLHQHPEIDAVFSHMRCFLSPDLSEAERRARFCPPKPVPGLVAGTALISRSAFEKVGLFDPKWRIGEFVDWLARAESKGIVYKMLPDVFLARRIHSSNNVVTDKSSRSDYLKIVKAALDRKRRAA